MHLPDYQGGSIVNLMATILGALGRERSLYAGLPQLSRDELSDARNVLLLVVDGLGYDYLHACAGSFLGEHCRARLTSVFPPTTASAITTFLTGLAPQQHGLTGWYMYFRELGTVSAVLPFTPRYGGSAFGTAGIEPSAFFGHAPVFDQLRVPSYLISPAYIVDSDFSRSHSGRAERMAYRDMDDFFAILESILARDRRRKYIYAYWSELDSLAHRYGVASREVAGQFAAIDAALAAFCEFIQGSGTLLIVTADHGLIDSEKDKQIWLEDHPRMAETLTLPLCGEPRVAYCYVRPGRQAQFEHYARDALAEQAQLFASHELVERGFFGEGEPHPRLRDRIGDYALLMKENYVLRDRLATEQPPAHVGVHGGVSSREMYVPLIVFQP